MEQAPNRIETVAQYSPEKAELLQLEKEGKYLFHGTAVDAETLEPRQAIDTKTGPDGDPAVFASDKADYAIFMAIVNRTNAPRGSHARAGATHDEESGLHTLDFGISKATFDQLQDSAGGYVYVFDKNDFISHPTKQGVEFVSYKPVKPVRKIRVSKRDLPQNIEIFEK